MIMTYIVLLFQATQYMLHLNTHFFLLLYIHRIEGSLYNIHDGPSLSLVIGIVAPIVLLVLAAAFICLVIGIRRKRRLRKKYHLFDFYVFIVTINIYTCTV